MSVRSAMTLMHIVFLIRSCIAAEQLVFNEAGVRHEQTGIDAEGKLALAPEYSSSPVRSNGASHEEHFTESLMAELVIGAIGFALTVLMQKIFRAKSKAASSRTRSAQFRRAWEAPQIKHEPAVSPILCGPATGNCVLELVEEAKDKDRMVKSEVRRLLAAVTLAKGGDIAPLVLRGISAIEGNQGATMNAKQVTDALTQLVRACTSSKLFNEALVAFDCLEERVGVGTKNLWSLLLYIAAEAGAYERCRTFYSRLEEPSGRDFVNIVRALARCQDLAGLQDTLELMRVSKCTVGSGNAAFDPDVRHRDSAESAVHDRVARNRALAACCKEGAVDLAVAIAYTDVFSEPLDSVGYNTLITCFSRAGDYMKSFSTFEEMEANAVLPTEATFGSLLEACCGAKDLTRAMWYLAKIQKQCLKVNAAHCTTLVKALVAEMRLGDAERLLDELSRQGDVRMDVLVFYTLLKAFCDNSDFAGALRVYKAMTRLDIKPDELVFNTLINGCASDPRATIDHFKLLMDELLAGGLKPTTTTVSIMLKALSRCGAWDAAHELLLTAESRFDAKVETRLFVQLAQAALKAGLKSKAIEIHDTMVTVQGRRGQEGKAASRWLLRQCGRGPSSKPSQ
jgi:pentatricopeptide repeat protein